MSEKLRLPDFIIGGAPKCGTSSLYFWLNAHPECSGSKVKETFFFADEINRFNESCNFQNNSLSDYSKYFDNMPIHSKAFEATAHYIYYNTARQEFLKMESKPKMIFILREPSKQILSHYSMIKYRLKRYDKPFSEYITTDYATNYVKYAECLKLWKESWPEDRLLVITFEELMQSKVSTMSKIADFLNIDAGFYSSFDFEHRNESVVIRSGKLHQFGLKMQRYIPFGLQKALLPLYMKLNGAGKAPREENTDQYLAEMKAKFAYQADQLDALFPNLHAKKFWL